MSKRRKKPGKPKAGGSFPRRYEHACGMAVHGRHADARHLYEELARRAPDATRRALVLNDLGTLDALAGRTDQARERFTAALTLDPGCGPAGANLDLLGPAGGAEPAPVGSGSAPALPVTWRSGPIRVALVSFLFNWPSTGGGIVHTVELAQFLARADYAVHHFHLVQPAWGIGRVEGPLPYDSTGIAFADGNWCPEAVQAAFREAVDAFRPDYVIVTDSWNTKPLLAEAVSAYRYLLRFQAMECFCPLNNVRLLCEGGRLEQCPRHQLATPDTCADCVRRRGDQSGALHQAERAFAGVGTPGYHERLLRVLAGAEAVLVVNPLHEAILGPYCKEVRVVTAGMDPARFPWPWPDEPAPTPGRVTLLFAGLVEERMKGFDVLHEACARLWQGRQDFELVATADPVGQADPFTRFIGWQSQAELPRQLRAADVLVMPTVAQEALGRTAVEAMAAGRPVIASRLGGLPFTVIDGATGLLCEPGNAEDLARKIECLLDGAELRQRLGEAGRRRFEEHYAWPVIIEKHYRPLLCRRVQQQ